MSRRLIDNAFEWIADHELALLLGLLIVVGGTWSFLAIADNVSDGETQRTDERVLLSLRNADDLSQPVGPAWLLPVMRDVTALGGFAVLIFVTFVSLTFLWVDRRYRSLAFVSASILGGFALAIGLKAFFGRARPEIIPHLTQAKLSSFPSGHSMMSAIVYITLGTLLSRLVHRKGVRVFVIAVPLFLTMMIGISRVYLGVHYPSDVLAGWSAGLAWSSLCWLVARGLGMGSITDSVFDAGENS